MRDMSKGWGVRNGDGGMAQADVGAKTGGGDPEDRSAMPATAPPTGTRPYFSGATYLSGVPPVFAVL